MAAITAMANVRGHGTTKRGKWRSAVFTLVALFIGAFTSLAIAEFAVRIFAPQVMISDIIVPDPDVDYRLRPNSKGRMSSPEYSAEIRVNSLGFRGPEISPAKKAGVVRVLFLGDSFMFGHGLAENETLPFFVAQELERTRPDKFEVVNGGVYGYSTADELNFFVKFGAPLKPDIVITLFYTNDLFDNPAVYSLGREGKLVKQENSSYYNNSRRITRFIPGANWLRENSHLFKFVGVRLLPVIGMRADGLVRSNGADGNQAQPAVHGSWPEFTPEFYHDKGGLFPVTVAILGELARRAKENKARSILLMVGDENDFHNGRLKPGVQSFYRQLSRAALDAGFSRTLALSPLLLAYRGEKKLFFPVDTHWTGDATKLVAPAVAEVIGQTAAEPGR